MISFDEKLSTKWYDTLTVIPDDGDNVWFIVGDKIHVGVFISELKSFCKADRSHYDLSEVRQWTPLTGDKQLGNYPEEGQIVAANIPGLDCFVTGVFSEDLGQENLGQNGPGILLDQEYNLFELGINNPLPWECVFEWYKLPLEPLLLLPNVDSELNPLTISELSDGECCSCEQEQPKEEVDAPFEATDNPQQIRSAIVASKKNLAEHNDEDRSMSDKLQEARISYELTEYGSYQPWGQAKEAWQYILDNGKFNEFDQLLEEWYPEGIGETELNDILAFEPETIYPSLGLRDPYNKDVTEDDFDGYTELTTVNDILLCDVDEDGEFADILEFFAKDMGLSEEDAKKVLTDKGYIKNDQLVIPAGRTCTVKDNYNTYEIETEDFPTSFDAYDPDTSDFQLAESIKTLDLDNLKESIKKLEYSKNIIGYAEPGDDIYLFYKSRPIGFIDAESKRVFLAKNCPSEACELFSDYRELNNSCYEESKKSDNKRLKEDYGWECDPESAWDLLDEMKEVFGADYLLESIAKAMGTYDLAENLAFICRNEDFRSQYLGNLDDEDEYEEEEESIKSSDSRLKEGGRRNSKVKSWYVKKYPTDELGPDINDNITFTDILDFMRVGRNIYDILGVDDSLVRERVFAELAGRLHMSYDEIYNLWLGESKNTEGKLTESKSDGWPQEVVDAFRDVFYDIDRFQYEINRCRRGVYTGATTLDVLAEAAARIGREWDEVVEDLPGMDDPDFDDEE